MKEEEKHSFLSPSAAHRWLKCTPSARVEQLFPDVKSEAAEEGTLAHRLAFISISRMIGNTTPQDARDMIKDVQRDKSYSIEMNEYVSSYVDAISEEVMQIPGEIVEAEMQIDLSDFIPACKGTVDAFVARPKDLHVFDLKYGKGVKVDAENNPQLMIYALGILTKYIHFFDSNVKVTLHIFQPRLNSHSLHVLKSVDLFNWGIKYLKQRSLDAFFGYGEFVTGEHCKFCKAKGACRKLADESLGINDKEVALLSVDEISEKLTKLPVVETWCKALQENALRQLINGVKIPGYKVVEGRSIRRYKDESLMLDALKSNGIDENLVVKKSLISLTELEKILGKKEVSSVYGDYIVKPSGKPTVVPEDDKREAIDASYDFKDIYIN